MKLKRFRVQNYRSVVDSGYINAEDIMVLVGPNQSGKTSILLGLYSISFNEKYKDVELTQLDNISKRFMDNELNPDELPIVTAVFEPENDNDKNLINDIINNSSTDASSQNNEPSSMQHNVTLTKFINNNYKIQIDDFEFIFNKQQLINSINDIENNNEIAQYFKNQQNQQYKNKFDNVLKELKSILLNDDIDFDLFQNKLKELADIDQTLKTIIERIVEPLKIEISKFQHLYKLLKRLPHMVYFKDRYLLEDIVTIDELERNPDGHKTFYNLLKLAEIKLETIKKYSDDTQRLQQYLKSATGNVSKKLQTIWGQEKFDIDIRYSDKKLMVFTTDPSEPSILLPPSFGSEGFQWYLGFYIHFAVATESEYKDAILLLDDPGVLLHPSGHKDLLNRFKEYLENNNVRTIYSTHLPTMIPKDSITSIRVLEKYNGKTHVYERPWESTTSDAWAPLRAALGIDLTDSLFMGNETILVEGPSDIVYLQGFIKILRNKGTKISNRFILSIGGITNRNHYIGLFKSQRIPYVIVVDKEKKNNLQDERIIEIDPKNKFRKGQTAFDIEDLIENELLIDVIMKIYENVEKEKLQKKLTENDKKAVNILKEFLNQQKQKLDKIQIAKMVIEKINIEPDKYTETIENFQDLLNKVESKFS